jgi:SAM-dependent methyltransferase
MPGDDMTQVNYDDATESRIQSKMLERQMPKSLQRLMRSFGQSPEFRSGDYWDRRYKTGRTSGAGSYGRLAWFKAEVINRFCAEHDVRSVIEWGCGDGNQLELYEFPRYVGADVSSTSIKMCRERFDDPSKTFLLAADVTPAIGRFDLSMAIDVIFHLVEDDVFDRFMEGLFDYSSRFVCIYSSNTNRKTLHRHVRHRRFTDWIERNRPEWRLDTFVRNRHRVPIGFENKYFTFCDFYFFARGDGTPAQPI